MYYIMHRDKIVAEADEQSITGIYEKELCPACFFVGQDLDFWLKGRYIDVHRSHSRRLFKALRLKTDADLCDIIDIGHGVSITDNWWIKRKSDTASEYKTLKEFNEEISNIAFYGSPINDFNIKGYTELGTVGSYEKTWKFINGSWYIMKQGNKAELVSEYFAYSFLKEMNVPVAEYSILHSSTAMGFEQDYIISKDFTDNARYDFEPFCNYFNDNEEYDYIIPRLKQLETDNNCSGLAAQYVEMCLYDALLFNVDRHNQNAGFLRDSSSGRIVSLAPCYDYNLAMAATKTPIFNQSGDLMKFFVESDLCMDMIDNIKCPAKDDIRLALEKAVEQTKKAFPKDSIDYSVFTDYVLNAYDYFFSALQKYPLNSESLDNKCSKK